MQLPMFNTPSDWRAPALRDLPSLNRAKRIGLDVETCDPQLKQLGPGALRPGSFLAGVSIALEDGPSYYLPLAHAGGDNIEDPAKALEWLRHELGQYTGIVVGANITYDLNFLAANGVHLAHAHRIRDVQVADPLIYELHRSYSLQAIAERHGLPGKDETLLKEAAQQHGVDAKSSMWKLPARYVGPYAERDAEEPLAILRRQERIIDDLDLWDIYELESQATPVLAKMTQRGVLVSQDRLAQVEQWSEQQERDALAKVHHATGVTIPLGEVWKPERLAPALEATGITIGQTSTGQPNIDKNLLARANNETAAAILWARKVNKLRTTFAASVRAHMINGRIHCTFNQIARETEAGEQKGARFGRLSCQNPNLQQQPARDEFAAMWRAIYLPELRQDWASCDISQQEPRWTTHFAAALGLPKAAEAVAKYRDDPTTDNHQFMADLTGLDRKPAKNIFLGLCYGEGGAKLCRDLGLPTRWALRENRQVSYYETREEAQAAKQAGGFMWEAAGTEGQNILDRFDAHAPYVRGLSREASKKAAQRGWVRTAGGRLLHFPERDDGTYDWTHKALNRLIQGTSADQLKKAMVEIDREVPEFWMQLQVHDEVTGSIHDRSAADRAAKVMSECLPAKVPFAVDVEIGASWGESGE